MMAHILMSPNFASWCVDDGDSISLHLQYPEPHTCGYCGRVVTHFVNRWGKTMCSECDATQPAPEAASQ